MYIIVVDVITIMLFKMKNVFLLIIVYFLMFENGLKAQDFGYGIELGIQQYGRFCCAAFDNQYRYYDEYLPSFNFNAYIGYRSKSFWGLSFEPGFLQNQVEEDFTKDNSIWKYNSFQAPFFINIYFKEIYFFSLGVEASYLFSADFNITNAVLNPVDLLKRPELYSVLGFNYDFFNHMTIGFRFKYGLNQFYELKTNIDNLKMISKSKICNKYFQFLLRYAF
jgi:hypothetical protein